MKKIGRTPIKDKFTDLPISRQRRWQMRKAERGLCILCGKKTVNNWHCLEHMVYMREWQARRDGATRKLNCMSRRLEGKKENRKLTFRSSETSKNGQKRSNIS